MQMWNAAAACGASNEMVFNSCVVKESKQTHGDRLGRCVRTVQHLQASHTALHGEVHPNIVSFQAIVAGASSSMFPRKGMFATSSVQAVVMERFQGSLHHLDPRQLCHTDQWRMLSEVVAAVNSAHDAEVAHGSLSPEHIMLRPDGTVAVTGWGSSRTGATSSTVATSAPHGSPLFQAPEVQACARAGNACQHQYRVLPADVWSLGMLAVYISAPVLWRAAVETLEPAAPVSEEEFNRRLSVLLVAARSVLDPGMAAVVTRTLDRDPEARPLIAEIAGLVAAGAQAAHGRRQQCSLLPFEVSIRAKEERAARWAAQTLPVLQAHAAVAALPVATSHAGNAHNPKVRCCASPPACLCTMRCRSHSRTVST